MSNSEEKIKVPKDYFIEMSNELAKSYTDAKKRPQFQLDRIKAVIEIGKDYEAMMLGTTENIIPLEKLMEYYQEAKKVDVDALKKRWIDFTTAHEIDPKMKGDIIGAKKDVDQYCSIYVGYNDSENNYELLHDISHKYFLSEKQMDKLMEYMMKMDFLR